MSVTDVSKLRLETREPHQVSTQTESCTLPGSQANTRGQQIQQSEGDSGDNGDGQDLLNVQLLLRDDEGCQRNGQTFQKVLDSAGNQLSDCETVHTYNQGPENLSIRMRLYTSV